MGGIMTLNEKQQEALDLFKSGQKKIFITGSAGTGKGIVAKFIADEATSKKKKVYMVAPTHKAKKVLSDYVRENRAVKTMTIHRMLGYILKEGDPVKESGSHLVKAIEEPFTSDVIICDEISMVSKKFLKELEPLCTSIIVIGDMNQLPLVGRGEEKADLSEYLKVELTQQMRQENEALGLKEEIKRSLSFVKNKTKSRFYIEANDSSIIESESLVDEYVNRKIDVILAYRNATVNIYNKMIQTRLFGENILQDGQNMILQAPIKGRNNGDTVLIEGVKKLKFGYVLYVNDKQYYMVDDGYNWFKWMLSMDFDRSEYKEWKDKKIIAKPIYAMTVHKSQGSSYNNVGINMGDINTCYDADTRNRLVFVALSRARRSVLWV
jgi:ATP-dependent exoDNAse (exonuclease V) alpha subunit